MVKAIFKTTSIVNQYKTQLKVMLIIQIVKEPKKHMFKPKKVVHVLSLPGYIVLNG